MTDCPIPAGVPVILASQSPRRRELLTEMGIPFTILTGGGDERYPGDMHPRDAVRYLSEQKAYGVRGIAPPEALIIASDTLVEVDGTPLGKPKDARDARRMLSLLSGRHHCVHTGVCVLYRGQVLSATETTEVCFRPLTDAEIDAYLATGEPFDKAGAYGIQGQGGCLVSHIRGNLDTVIGLCRETLLRLLREIRYDE